MQPSYSSIGQIFSAQTRYTVPLFQRPYVWSKEEQWQPLWDDVRELADRVLSPRPHKPVAGHFLGTVVLEQINTSSIAMPQRRVIDGQQRLTTLQLLLKAAEHALHEVSLTASPDSAKSIELAAGQTSQLSRNHYAQQPEEAYKVWPTNDDRTAFKAVMDSEPAAGVGSEQSRMADAYRFFRDAILGWLGQQDVAQRALAFAAALKDHLRLIVLDLDESDEPQAIFETLNAHGTPLLPADLIKNWLLWQAGKQELDADPLYQTCWSQFDREHLYWRKTIGTGHAARPRVDTFLQNWLTVMTGEQIPVKHLYDRFLAYANALADKNEDQRLDVAALMGSVHEHAAYYRIVDAPDGDAALAATLRRLNRLDFVVFRPVLMALFARVDDVATGAKAIESFLVRRMVCERQTRGYGALALELVRAVNDVPGDVSAVPQLITVLGDAAGGWPDDDAFQRDWRSRRFYGLFRRDRVAMILQALEEHYQQDVSKTEPLLTFDFAKLQIEHIMPQSWAAHWPLAEAGDPLLRDDRVQNIGNLTLVSEKLNPSLSNGPWHVEGSVNCKSAQLAKHSALRLNKLLLDGQSGGWTEQDIEGRADSLFAGARSVWPQASTLKPAALPEI
ncbi:DUF262 domain-containing protein [Sphingoaurantiacus capsulatus]|uniref:DUF262 domain-containing protein n=1 Tax=Sphingoaurantiacus capsulatus TaxID=1771310 RepID=A0ABV7XAS7_9SPHN